MPNKSQKSQIFIECKLTARQYGEVVLPDEATEQVLITLARKLSRCKEGMARVFAVQVQILLSITCVAVQV
jgi:nitrogen regulatory protein PII